MCVSFCLCIYKYRERERERARDRMSNSDLGKKFVFLSCARTFVVEVRLLPKRHIAGKHMCNKSRSCTTSGISINQINTHASSST